MYSEKDLLEIKGQIKRIVLITVLIFGVFLVFSIYLSGAVNSTWGMILLVVGVCLDIFIWGVYGTPVVVYYRFLKDILTGRSRNIYGLVRKVSDQPVYKDNKLYFYEVTIEENGIERMLLLDTHRDISVLKAGVEFQFEIHENYIKNISNK